MNEDDRNCWVCLATENEDNYYRVGSKFYRHSWVCPCKCRGTTKWVHQACLLRWIDEKQKGNRSLPVSCPQCQYEYKFILPFAGPLVTVLERMDYSIQRSCPFIAGGIIISSLYWSAFTYGAISLMQVMGMSEGFYVFEQSDPILLLICLPMIPIVLIVAKTIQWDEYVLQLWRTYSPIIESMYATFLSTGSLNHYGISPLPSPAESNYTSTTSENNPRSPSNTDNQTLDNNNTLIVNDSTTPLNPNSNNAENQENNDSTPINNTETGIENENQTDPGEENGNGTNSNLIFSTNHLSATRVLCGALALPTLATLTGKYLFPHIKSNVGRAFVGCLSYLAIKGVLTLYYKQRQYNRMQQRTVLNYNPLLSSNTNLVSPSESNTVNNLSSQYRSSSFLLDYNNASASYPSSNTPFLEIYYG